MNKFSSSSSSSLSLSRSLSSTHREREQEERRRRRRRSCAHMARRSKTPPHKCATAWLRCGRHRVFNSSVSVRIVYRSSDRPICVRRERGPRDCSSHGQHGQLHDQGHQVKGTPPRCFWKCSVMKWLQATKEKVGCFTTCAHPLTPHAHTFVEGQRVRKRERERS